MKYLSTRGGESELVSPLYYWMVWQKMVVYTFQNLSLVFFWRFKQLSHMSYPELCYETKGFMSESDIPTEIIKICFDTYDNKFGKNIIDIDKLSEYENILNLYHGKH